MTRQQAQYAQRKADGRCVKCGDRQPPERVGMSCCVDCQRANSIVRAAHYRPSPRRAALQQAMDFVLAHPELDAQTQANRLGVSIDRVYAARTKARRLGHDVEWARPGVESGGESTKWAALDHATERCVCGLLLPCEDCVPSAAELASHSGPGRVYPGSPL